MDKQKQRIIIEKISKESGNIDLTKYSSEYLLVVVVSNGSAFYTSNKNTYHVNLGDVAFPSISANCRINKLIKFQCFVLKFDLKQLESYKKDLGLFLDSFYSPLYDNIKPMSLKANSFQQILNILIQIENESKIQNDDYELIVFGLFIQLATIITRTYIEQKNKIISPYGKLNKVIEYIQDNYAGQISLDLICKKFHFSKNHFIRIFKKAYNQTPIDFIIKYRIQKACELLQNTGIAITDIAFNVGFMDSNYFTRQFIKINHLTPSDYRKNMDMANNQGGIILIIPYDQLNFNLHVWDYYSILTYEILNLVTRSGYYFQIMPVYGNFSFSEIKKSILKTGRNLKGFALIDEISIFSSSQLSNIVKLDKPVISINENIDIPGINSDVR